MRYLLLILCLSGGLANAQYFSGELTYSLKIIPKQANLDVDSIMNQQPGDKSIYLITESFYKSTYFRKGKQTYSYTYHDLSKRMYDEEADKDLSRFGIRAKAIQIVFVPLSIRIA